MTVAVQAGAATHAGCVRSDNQDHVRSAPPVFAVADGMGGHAGGEVASALALGAFDRFDGAGVVDPGSVLVAVREANTEILRQAEANPDLAGLGSTVVGVVLARKDGADAIAAFNVGDSRVYRLRHGALELISTDHSVVAELVASGRLAPGDASTHPDRHVITRALGVEPSVEVDTWLLVPEPGDRFLVCSDGLTNEVGGDDLAAQLEADRSPEEVAGALVALALDRGASDNVTALVVDVVGVDAPAGPHQDGDGTSEVDEDTLRPPSARATG
ncbi:MAG: PP2C family protein-serine/threonine phosphatase [Actinomycetes bacterium]